MNRSAVIAELKRGTWAMCPKALQSFLLAIRDGGSGPRGHSADDGEAMREAHTAPAIEAQKYTPAQDRKTAQQSGTVVVLPLRGIIDYRSSLFLQWFGGTAVEDFAKKFSSFINDSQVKAIIIDVDSPGGNVSGCTELAKMIFEARGSKPVVAMVNPLACSAAYWIASAAPEMVITPSGEAGSVGVYTLHEDISKYLEDLGIKETFVYAGKNKVEGNAFEPLGDEAKAHLQSVIDGFYKMFVDDVARNRGIKPAEVEKNFGQGRAFGADECLSRGMVDRVDTLQGTLARFGVSLYGEQASRRATPVERMARQVRLMGAGCAQPVQNTPKVSTPAK